MKRALVLVLLLPAWALAHDVTVWVIRNNNARPEDKQDLPTMGRTDDTPALKTQLLTGKNTDYTVVKISEKDSREQDFFKDLEARGVAYRHKRFTVGTETDPRTGQTWPAITNYVELAPLPNLNEDIRDVKVSTPDRGR